VGAQDGTLTGPRVGVQEKNSMEMLKLAFADQLA